MNKAIHQVQAPFTVTKEGGAAPEEQTDPPWNRQWRVREWQPWLGPECPTPSTKIPATRVLWENLLFAFFHFFITNLETSLVLSPNRKASFGKPRQFLQDKNISFSLNIIFLLPPQSAGNTVMSFGRKSISQKLVLFMDVLSTSTWSMRISLERKKEQEFWKTKLQLENKKVLKEGKADC